MPDISKKRDTGCPITFALDIFGDRWSLLIVRDLMLLNRKTYGDFLGGTEGFATNILANRLKELEAQGIIKKSRDPENRRRNIYGLTEKGVDLAPLIIDLFLWSAEYDPNSKVPDEMLDEIKKDRDGFIEGIRAAVLQERALED